MSTHSIMAGIAGAVLAAGLVTTWVGLRRSPVSSAVRRTPALPARLGTTGLLRASGAGAAGAVVLAVTRWPALGIVAALVVWGVPVLFSGARRARGDIARVEAVEDWVRRLTDVLVVGVGLGQAITATARSAPDQVRDEVESLAARVSARWPMEDALRAFASDIDDSAADLAVAALLLSERRKGPGLAAALSAIADALAEEVTMRRRVEADRARPRATARAVTVITLAVVGLGLLTGSYLAPYGTPLGQLVLVGVTGLFVTALAWMHTMAAGTSRPRLLRVRVAGGAPR